VLESVPTALPYAHHARARARARAMHAATESWSMAERGQGVHDVGKDKVGTHHDDDDDDVLDVRDGFSHHRLPPVDPEWEHVLRAISGLPVPFMSRKCRQVLRRAGSVSPELFTDPGLYWHAHHVLAESGCGIEDRRRIHSLFDNVRFHASDWSEQLGASKGTPLVRGAAALGRAGHHGGSSSTGWNPV